MAAWFSSVRTSSFSRAPIRSKISTIPGFELADTFARAASSAAWRRATTGSCEIWKISGGRSCIGSVMASYNVEAFSLERLRTLTQNDIDERYCIFQRMSQFEVPEGAFPGVQICARGADVRQVAELALDTCRAASEESEGTMRCWLLPASFAALLIPRKSDPIACRGCASGGRPAKIDPRADKIVHAISEFYGKAQHRRNPTYESRTSVRIADTPGRRRFRDLSFAFRERPNRSALKTKGKASRAVASSPMGRESR